MIISAELIICGLGRLSLICGIAVTVLSFIFFSFMRDAFFIKALYFKENSFHTRGMDNEQIRFIKELPNQYTDWLRVKVRFSVVGIIFLFMMLSVFYLPSFI